MAEGQVHGKQVVDGSIAESKLETAYTDEVIKRDGSVAYTGDQPMGGQKITGLGAPTAVDDAARLKDIQTVQFKEFCVAATTVNITLSGAQTIDTIGLIAGDRCLVKDQTLSQNNGIYVVSAGAWSRSSDADEADELTGAFVFVDTGAANQNTNFQQVNTIVTLGTDPQSWIAIGTGGGGSEPTAANKIMAASLTVSDEDQATATAIASTPANSSYVEVQVNGVSVTLGNGVKTNACYFSGDSGTTARSISAITAADTLHWVGSVAGYELATTDRIDFYYNV